MIGVIYQKLSAKVYRDLLIKIADPHLTDTERMVVAIEIAACRHLDSEQDKNAENVLKRMSDLQQQAVDDYITALAKVAEDDDDGLDDSEEEIDFGGPRGEDYEG